MKDKSLKHALLEQAFQRVQDEMDNLEYVFPEPWEVDSAKQGGYLRETIYKVLGATARVAAAGQQLYPFLQELDNKEHRP